MLSGCQRLGSLLGIVFHRGAGRRGFVFGRRTVSPRASSMRTSAKPYRSVLFTTRSPGAGSRPGGRGPKTDPDHPIVGSSALGRGRQLEPRAPVRVVFEGEDSLDGLGASGPGFEQ